MPRYRLFSSLPPPVMAPPIIAPTVGRTRGINPLVEPQELPEYQNKPEAVGQAKYIEILREGQQDAALRSLFREELRAVIGELGNQEKN